MDTFIAETVEAIREALISMKHALLGCPPSRAKVTAHKTGPDEYQWRTRCGLCGRLLKSETKNFRRQNKKTLL